MMYDIFWLACFFLLVSVGFNLFATLLRRWWYKRKDLVWVNQERRVVEKPWGHEDIWAETGRYVGKLLHINAGHSLSKQYHRVKDETIIIISGEMDLMIEKKQEEYCFPMHPGDSYHIEPYTIHRMVAITDVVVAEVSTPELEDVVRLEDKYGRK